MSEQTVPGPGGAAVGFDQRRTLPIRAELARQFRRPRTRLTLGFMVLLPLLLCLAFELGDDGDRRSSGLVDLAASSGLNFAIFTLFASTGFLLVVVVALFFGDTIASEASWSSLKYLLTIPVPRMRLLGRKAVVAALLSLLGLIILPTVAILVGLTVYGTGDMVTPVGEALPLSTGLVRILLAVAYLAVSLSWIAGLSLWLSVLTDAPLGAVGGAVLASILSQILDSITALGGLRDYLPSHYSFAWSDLLSLEVEWGDMARGAFSSLAYAAVFVLLAARHFSHKDITS